MIPPALGADGDALAAAKADLRRIATLRRAQTHAAKGQEAAASLVGQGLKALVPLKPRVVSGYLPIRTELDVRPLLMALGAATGAAVALPVVQGPGLRLLFRRWDPAQPLERGAYGTSHPAASAEALEPDLLLVPLLAFDLERRRLGYGAGYYGRTLAALRGTGTAHAVGIAFADQVVTRVPTGPNDQPLDLVLTERGPV